MTLPTSRNTTYAAGSQVKSADLNAVQDCIAGAKHPEVEFPYHAAAWQPLSGAGAYQGDDEWLPDPGGDALQTALAGIPVGDRITSVYFDYKRANAGTVTYGLYRKPRAGGAFAAVVSANDTTTNGYTQKSITGINHTIDGAYVYSLRVFFDGTAAAAGPRLVSGSAKADRL